MKALYPNHKRDTNQYNNTVLGNNLSQVPKDMRKEFSEKLRIKIISDDLIQTFDKYYDKLLLHDDINHYDMALHIIERMKKEWIKVLEYTNQLNPFYETCISKHIDQKILEFHDSPTASSYKIIENCIYKAKESGLDTKKYEIQLEILQKEWRIWTLHQKIQTCVVNDSMQNILSLKKYMKELISLWIFIWHQSIQETLDNIDVWLYTDQELDGMMWNIHKHASSYSQTKDINELDIIIEEISLAEQLWATIDIIWLSQLLWLQIIDKKSQEICVNSLLCELQEITKNSNSNKNSKEEIRKLSNLITIFS